MVSTGIRNATASTAIDSLPRKSSANEASAALIIAGVQAGGALLLVLARKQGMIDGETATRGVMVLIGLGIAAIGNRMPKLLDVPAPPSLAIAALQQAAHHVGGWAMMLAGLAYAGMWALYRAMWRWSAASLRSARGWL